RSRPRSNRRTTNPALHRLRIGVAAEHGRPQASPDPAILDVEVSSATLPVIGSSSTRSPSEPEESTMLSARNQFEGHVKSVKLGGIMAEVVVSVGGIEIVSAITRTSAESLGLKAGDKVRAIIKSTEVIIDK